MDASLINEKWDDIIHTLKKEYNVSDIAYQTWLKPLKFHNIEDKTINIVIPTDQAPALNYISTKYKIFFQVTITEMFNEEYNVNFILEKDIIENKESYDYNIKGEKQTSSLINNYEEAHLNSK